MRTYLAITAATLLGLLLGLSIDASAEPAGAWSCYVADRFPDVDAARTWKGAVKVEEGMNKVASNAPAGTVMTVPLPSGNNSGAPVVCIKQ